jgi:hypothetical protein
MNVIKMRSVDAAIRTLSEREKKKVFAWFNQLANWENDPHTREISKPSIYDDVYVLNTSDDIRVFFKLDLQKKEITVLDIAKPSRFEAAGKASKEEEISNMTALSRNAATTLDADIFLRLWDKQKLTPGVARHLLKLGFDADDEARIHELAGKNQEGEISRSELAELDQFVRVGAVLTILQSRARKLLRKSAASGNGRER